MRVIADIGSNWNTLDDCMRAIKFASKDDIDIVKFQYFTQEKLYGGERSPSTKRKGELPKAWIPRLAAQCEVSGVEFMCSVFDVHDVEYIDKYVNMHKIASAEATYKRLISKCVDTGKPVLVSCGCVDPWHLSHDVSPMACVADYPAESVPLKDLIFLSNQFAESGVPFGYSDHCIKHKDFSYNLALEMGASAYEFHYNPLNLSTPDTPHSRDKFIRPKPFKQTRNKDIARVQTSEGWYRKLDG